jgi:RNA polymerase sigma factor (sigma-70 family)
MDKAGPELLASLLDQYQGPLVLYARQWASAAEDVVQEAFWKLAGQSPWPDKPVAWLYRTVRNGAISAARADARRERHESAAAARAEPWFWSTDRDAVDATTAGEALARLPLEQRETIVARLWGGLSFEEIAELTGKSTSTAHRLYWAGLTVLREKLEEEPCSRKTSG